jgi:hypothetical protein
MSYKFWRLTNIFQKLVSHGSNFMSRESFFFTLKINFKMSCSRYLLNCQSWSFSVIVFSMLNFFHFLAMKTNILQRLLEDETDRKRIISINWLCFEKRRSRNATWPIFLQTLLLFFQFLVFLTPLLTWLIVANSLLNN